MIDSLTIVVALVIITTLVGFFGFLALKINMSDPLTRSENQQQTETVNEKKKKERNVNEQGKKKRKEQKKSKRDNRDEEEEEQQQRTKGKGPNVQTSEETDDEREESEQELLIEQPQSTETSGKARKRNKNKPSTTQTESAAKHEKNSGTTRAPPVTHPKSTTKDEHEGNKQSTKTQTKPTSQGSTKQTVTTASTATTTTTNKKPTTATKTPSADDDQPFTVVGGSRHKTGTSTSQQQQQQQNKSQTTTTPSSTTATIPAVAAQQPSSIQVHQEQSTHRQPVPQKQATAQATNLATSSTPAKQQQQTTSKVAPKVADLIKVLPTSQAVVTELMSALDAYPLATDELDILMQKIANKQSVVKQDWSKLQQGQKVDPQAHIGQVMDESTKAYVDDMKTNSMKRVKELTDELNAEKRRNHDLLKDKADKEREIQILHAQLDTVQHKTESGHNQQPQQQKLQTLESQLKRLTEENMHLNHQLAQQQHQPHMLTSPGSPSNDSLNVKVQVLSEQIKKLSVDNANLEKKAHSNELLAKEAQKEKEDLIRYNEQLTQSLETTGKELKAIEEKHHQQLNESQRTYLNEFNEMKRRLEQLERENEQLRREEIVHVEPSSPTHIQTLTVNNEEREQFEKDIQQLREIIDANQQKQHEYEETKQKLTQELEEYRKQVEQLQNQHQSQENDLRQEVDRLKQDLNRIQQQADESRRNELDSVRHELDTLRNEHDQVKSTLSQTQEHLRQEREKHRTLLSDLLPEDMRHQLPQDNQDFDQWMSSYRQVFETSKHNMQEECAALKRENERLNKNMSDIENQLKDIEQTVQRKEEALLTELQSKDASLEHIHHENDRLNGEMERLRSEIQRLQSMHDTATSEIHTLKQQLDEKFLMPVNSPPAAAADESFELVKQPSPSLSPLVIDIRAEHLNELIRSSKEALENQDSITQQLDQHLNNMHPSGQAETSMSNVTDSTMSSSSDQQSQS